jgi:predicted metal-dependent phosphoesterase TrpH
MQATAIVKQAKEVGLDMIGICDHNSAENVAAVVKAGAREGLPVIAGIEITSSEEAHILGLFDTERDLMHLQDEVYENLSGENNEEAFGPQTIVDEWDRVVGTNRRLLIGATALTVEQVVEAIHRRAEWDRVVGTNRRLLIGATALTVEQVVEAIHRRAGLAIASHVDRERFSLIGQLGFIPEGLSLDALEVSRPSSIRQAYDYPVVTFSDAHFLEDIGKNCTHFMIEDVSVDEITKALRNEMGRRIIVN